MFDWLHHFPDIIILPLIVFPIVIAQLVIRWFCHKYFLSGQTTNPLLFDSIGAMTVALSLILGLAFVEAKTTYKNVQMMISNEASQLNNLDNIITKMNEPEFKEIHKDLIMYTQSLIEDEWPALTKGSGSERTRRLLNPITKSIYTYRPQSQHDQVIYEKIISLTVDLMQSRQQIIQSADIKLDRIFWLTILTTLFIIFVAISFTHYSTLNIVMNFFYVALIASLIAFIFIFDEPFKGSSKISFAPIQKVLHYMQVR
ncbi:DUF4239 domain-containing protein [Legionella waltersii]|uniref:DUF4239 domain-containing protein n=1 Tax=Legionella waltersii TaxID=66969 RepID=A0A0W1AAF0_9GAMM|nr:DUF4239 domain-containing protein [Legionella waltersii]KTD78330.1 hypothetical protein Lwal_1765 [Legionella waltersii]SNV08667.1 Uncharacterised protein [Legionella waltersii]